jgi:hypothetical protein
MGNFMSARAMTHSLVLELGRGLLALVDGGASLRLSLAALDEVTQRGKSTLAHSR